MTLAWLILGILAIAAGVGAAYRVQAKRSALPSQAISPTSMGNFAPQPEITPQMAEEPDAEKPLQPPSALPSEATPAAPTAPAQEEEPIPVPPIAEPAAVEILLEEIEHHPEQEPV